MSPTSAREIETAAERLHSAAIHLLRGIRGADPETGLSPARISALSVLVFAGARTLGQLAAAEQVRPPTMSVIVRGLEADGLVARNADPDDGRVVRLRATTKGTRLLERARRRRLENLSERLEPLPREDVRTLARAADIIERALGR